MIPAVQSHIEAWTDPEELRYVYAKGARACRIAAMECSPEVMLANVRDANAAGLRPLVTLAAPQRIRLLHPADVIAVECRNEDDGDYMAMFRGESLWPWEYRRILDEFCEIGREVGIPIAGPVCSNTNRKCINWARGVRGDGWPKGMGFLSWHSYDPHENTLLAEMEALADGLPIIISEFGYPSMGGAEDEQAAKARDLWPVYAKYYMASWFQLHDGPDPNEREHCYGLRANDGHWKPVASTLPTQEIQMLEVHHALSRKDAIKQPDGRSTYPHPDGDGSVLAIEPGGIVAKRPKGSAGAYEAARDDGTKAVWEYEHDGRKHVYAILLVD